MPLYIIQLCTSPLFSKIGIRTLFLHSSGKLSLFIVLLYSFIRNSSAISPIHFQTSTGMSSEAAAFQLFILFMFSPTSSLLIFSTSRFTLSPSFSLLSLIFFIRQSLVIFLPYSQCALLICHYLSIIILYQPDLGTSSPDWCLCLTNRHSVFSPSLEFNSSYNSSSDYICGCVRHFWSWFQIYPEHATFLCGRNCQLRRYRASFCFSYILQTLGLTQEWFISVFGVTISELRRWVSKARPLDRQSGGLTTSYRFPSVDIVF